MVRPTHSTSIVTLLMLFLSVTDARAQLSGTWVGRTSPDWEPGIHLGCWNLMRSGFAGGRVTRNVNDVVGLELIADTRPKASDTDPAYALAGLQLKVGLPFKTGAGAPYSIFLTSGYAVAAGLSVPLTRTFGAGFQTRGRSLGLRVEFQNLIAGHTLNNSGRVLMGFSAGTRH